MLLAVLEPRAAFEKHAASVAAKLPLRRGQVATTRRFEPANSSIPNKSALPPREKSQTASPVAEVRLKVMDVRGIGGQESGRLAE
jgi:hypothetical protein